MLCEIKKKEKQQFGGKFGKGCRSPRKKIWSNSCTIPQIIAIIEYKIFMKKKKSSFFFSQPHDCTPKTLLIESGVTITVFFLHPIPLLFLIPHQLITPLYYVLRLLIKKLGHNILNCKNGWILSALKKRCLNKKTLPKKVSK